MAKKKKHKKKQMTCQDIMRELKHESKHNINKRFNQALKDIESYKLMMIEIEKRGAPRKDRKNLNKRAREEYEEMEAIICRKRMSKKWERSGFLDEMLRLLQETVPVVKELARALAGLIIAFLKYDKIKDMIKPKTLEKIQMVFQIIMAL